ncbi:MAG: PAS domain-containing protein [Candidatus Pacebacteria bacterium]|nr:PAS domain-containing protein [Candidatus Paceibacterota bacterium]
MKTISSGSKRFGSPIWEFFFQLTVISPSSTSWSLFCMLAGRILNLSHPIMLMLYGTSYTRYSDFAAYLSFTSYFTSESGLFAFAYILFVLIQLLVLGLLLQFLYLRDRLHAHHHLNERSFSCEFLHASFVFCAKVMPHICVSTLGLCVAGLVEAPGTVFSEYKHIMSPPNVSTQLYSCVTLLTVSSVEVLCIGTCFLVFCQDRSVLGNSFWSAETWYHPVAELLFVGLIETDFDSAMSPELSYILRAIGRLLCLIIFLGYTKYWKFWVDLGEFFFATLEIEITVFILAFTMLGWGFESYVSYPLLMICLSGLLCLIRAHTVWNPWLEPAKNEAEAVGSIRTVVTLARNRDSLATLSGLLLIHSQRCRNAECDCKKLISEFRKASSQGPLLGIHATMKQCEVVYFCADQVPQGIKEGAVMRAMQILVDDASSNAVRGEDLSMAQGEVAFYFVANFYAALQRIGQIELAKPRLLMKQRTYNLRRAISMGFDRAALETEDPEKTLSSLEYLKHYHKFLDQVEEATEATIKFWSIVMEDAPSSNKLNDLGKSLFKCKYKSTKTVEKISSLASNHMEFLVRYGLFMRLVMHDMITSEQIYQKLLFMSSNEGNGSRLDRNSSAFSLFRTDVSVMVIIAHMESSGAGSVCEMNTAVEQTLGYPRQDLMGASIANIMPQPVAQMHDEVVRRFFQTMKSSAINVPRAMFVKTKEGFYILCRTLMKIVPKLGRKLEVAMFLVPDRKVAYYTTDRLAPAGKKTGFVLCDPKHHGIYGFNRDGLTIIGISEDRMREFIGNATICDIFPWMGKKEFVEKLLDKEGRVVSFQSSQVMGALVNEGAAGADNTKIHRTGGNRSTDTTLLWIRLVAEQTTDSTELLASFIFSEIPKESRKNYVPDEDDPSGVFYCDPRMKSMTLRAATLASRDNRSLGTMSKARLPQHEEKKRAAPVIDFSDVASVASMASCDSTGTRTDSAGFYEATHELQIASITKQTPPAIKRFGVTMFGMLVVVVVLICVSTYVSIQEVGALKSRFGLIKEYHLRYKEIQMLTDSTRIYYPDYVLANVVDPVNGILDTRITTLTAFNVNTRKLLFSQKLEYDSEIVGITDISDTELTGTFSYAIILVRSLS